MGLPRISFAATLLVSVALGQWATVVVPSNGHPERIRTLCDAGVAIAHTDAFVVLSGSPQSLAAAEAKGWPFVVTPEVPAGDLL